ncbi:hypothetical protein HN419_01675 [Candidatus Woesearchaeota archaeon]|jgi:hypothetical protein|nr:hypothetical protein [Candidatus Woesearchaeota archaeon]MBT3537294.1 hypothetical protein [Candidatus Woesearchaeota archaeon]MBT4696757.1 hypothetical protein [Candidatus Woesearchaeota archaeon]MBT4716740.1 hypothetical protein [Candidatus Woesearchaeota archaeon]MBT7106396.1 hypothetical protein [Candidatus Woesearchaeota archaeon]
MKKLIALFAILAVCIFLTACGESTVQPTKTIESTPDAEVVAEPEVEPEPVVEEPEIVEEPEAVPEVSEVPTELTDLEIEAARSSIKGATRAKVYPAFKNLKVGETGIFGLAIKNTKPKAYQYTIEIRDVSLEEKIGSGSYQRINDDIDITSWLDENYLSNFEIAANEVGVLQLTITAKDMVKADLETRPGMRIKLFIDVFEYDGGFTEQAGKAELDIRVVE